MFVIKARSCIQPQGLGKEAQCLPYLLCMAGADRLTTSFNRLRHVKTFILFLVAIAEETDLLNTFKIKYLKNNDLIQF